MAHVRTSGLTIEHGGDPVLDTADIEIRDGQIAVVVGASGAGKTTLLRALAGLDHPARGTIWFDDLDVTDAPPAERNVAMAFQTPALYPRRNVSRNISFPLEVRHEAAEQIRARVNAEARSLHIDDLLRSRVDQLSAGEAHIVQIARALVRNPALLLLDEPFAGLDPERADQIRREILLIQRGFGVTTLLSTNDPREAMAVADVLIVLERGRIVQNAPPMEIYEQPDTATAALMTGEADVLDVRVTVDSDGAWLVGDGFRLRAWQPALRRHGHRRLQLVVRPDWWMVDDRGTIEVTIQHVLRVGNTFHLSVAGGEQRWGLKLAASRIDSPNPGDTIRLRLDRSVLLDPLDGRRLSLEP